MVERAKHEWPRIKYGVTTYSYKSCDSSDYY